MTRFFDIVFSFVGLIIVSPIFFIIALLVGLGSKGGVIYRQERIGRHGQPFRLYKFRSMYTDADKKGLLITVGERDPRITPVGYFLRKYKLDELPQLLNVLKGEMSIVGPRPEVKRYVDLYTADQLRILNVRPGITDWASIKYKSENEILKQYPDPEKAYIEIVMPEKIKLNMNYINQPTVGSYFSIIFKTIQEII